MSSPRGRTRTYYETLLVQDRTIGLTMDEARGDLDRAFVTLSQLSLN
ncbi:MAG: hypothetical protein U0360_02330 [Dehalococcoidia bacterium]